MKESSIPGPLSLKAAFTLEIEVREEDRKEPNVTLFFHDGKLTDSKTEPLDGKTYFGSDPVSLPYPTLDLRLCDSRGREGGREEAYGDQV